jgi:tRNA (cytidine/uridine-2'-O-)-methyltransferase
LKIPIDKSRVRSLNLATTVGVALFEAIRQLALHR